MHPFVSGTTDDVTLKSTSYPVYQVVINQEQYEEFVNALNEREWLKNYLKCAGETINDVLNYPAIMPALYVEVNKDDQFTRLYFSANGKAASMTLDLGLAYPETINVQRPQTSMSLKEATDAMAEKVLAEPEPLVEE